MLALQLTRSKVKGYRTKVNAHPFFLNHHEGNSKRPGFDLGTRMIIRDIYGTIKSTTSGEQRIRRDEHPCATYFLFPYTAMGICPVACLH